ncbi:MAG: hypothetical protein HYV09_23375 [Deltaproteobacteria bacterium]|nr:hypothetical protein [Deltaproteobacteria bacterium]
MAFRRCLLGRCVATCTSLSLGFATVTAAPTPAVADGAPAGHRVKIETKQSGVVLERLVGSPGAAEPRRWVRVCAAPCDVEVPAAAEYRLGGAGLRSSSPFTIDRPSTIEADLGSAWAFWTGAGVGVAGVALGAIGVLTVSADANASSTVGEEERDSVNVGWVLTAAGIVLIGTGVALLVGNRNSVTVDGTTVARRPAWRAFGVRLTPNGFVF